MQLSLQHIPEYKGEHQTERGADKALKIQKSEPKAQEGAQNNIKESSCAIYSVACPNAFAMPIKWSQNDKAAM